MGKTEQKSFKYVGFTIEQTNEGIFVSQKDFADEKIEIFDVQPERAM